MTITTTNTARQPKGIPVGGQFSSIDRAEGQVQLVLNPASLTGQEIMEQSLALAKAAGFRSGLSDQDIEDVSQETALSVLKTQSRNKDAIITGGLLRVASQALVSRLVDSHVRHEDSAALTVWKSRSSELEQELGRSLTPLELDQMAVDIRANWHNPRHKPRVGFQHQSRFVSTEAMGAMFTDTYAGGPEKVQDSGYLREIADSLEDEGSNRESVRLQMWNIMSREHGAPRVALAGMTVRAAARHKRTVGDAVTASEKFIDGELSVDAEASLFAPFGTITGREKRRVASIIVARPNVGDKLWRSAMDLAAKSSDQVAA
jgi:hypothetical protein